MDSREGRTGNSYACERCRKHKVRCVPSEGAAICQRCQKAGVPCVAHSARRRPAKPKVVAQAPHRVAEIEKKINELSAMVTATTTETSTSAALPSLTTLPLPAEEGARQAQTVALKVSTTPMLPIPNAPILPNPRTTPATALSFWETLNDTISGLGRLDPVIRRITAIHMQLLLETYKPMVEYFPFVPLPKDCFCHDLLQKRPMLMFAVLTVASFDSATLQLSLSREFRKVIMAKIFNGEKSLDLLQGLLLFIAWHHHYMDSQAISIPMLIQICMGIAADLRLDSIPPSHAAEYANDREAKRAYLGCYFLSTGYGMLEVERPRTLPYSGTVKEYAADLASAGEHMADAMIPLLVETCQFVEDVSETFQDHSTQALVVRSQVKRLSDKWDTIRDASKRIPFDFKALDWVQLAARVYLYKSASSLDLLDGDSTLSASGFQLSLRIHCLRSIEQLLEASAKLETAQYEYISLVDWLNLISTLTALGRLTLHASRISGWDPADLKLSQRFEHFRDRLCERFPRPLDGQQHNDDVYERFRRITAVMTMALRGASGRESPPVSSSFEITTSSRQAVSILQDLPPLKHVGSVNHVENLPAPWKVNPTFDMSSHEFSYKFLLGAV